METQIKNEKIEQAKPLLERIVFAHRFEDWEDEDEDDAEIKKIEKELFDLGIFDEKGAFNDTPEAEELYIWLMNEVL